MSLLLFIKTSLAPWPTPEIDVGSPKVRGLNAALLVSLFSGAKREGLPILFHVVIQSKAVAGERSLHVQVCFDTVHASCMWELLCHSSFIWQLTGCSFASHGWKDERQKGWK